MEVKVNQKVELEILDGPGKGVYSSRIEEVFPDRLAIAWPTAGGLPVEARVGTRVRVDCLAERAINRLWTEVVGRELAPVPVLLVDRRAKSIRIQRRQFVRLDVSVGVKFGILWAPDPFDGPTPLIFEGRTRDLSGGGILLITEIRLVPTTQLDMVINLPSKRISAVGEVVMIQKVETEQDGNRYWTGIRFIGIEERDRDAIVKFIFREQRERRRRGLL